MSLPAPSSRMVAGFLVMMLVAAGCGADSSAGESTASEPIIETPSAPIEAEVALFEVLPGREAIAAAQGEPHILWFWGAH